MNPKIRTPPQWDPVGYPMMGYPLAPLGLHPLSVAGSSAVYAPHPLLNPFGTYGADAGILGEYAAANAINGVAS